MSQPFCQPTLESQPVGYIQKVRLVHNENNLLYFALFKEMFNGVSIHIHLGKDEQ